MRPRWRPPAESPLLALLWTKLTVMSFILPWEWWRSPATATALANAVVVHPVVPTATLGMLLVLAAFVQPLPRSGRRSALWALNLFLTFVALADLVSARAYGDVLSLRNSVQWTQLAEAMPAIRHAQRTGDLLWFVDLALWPLVWWRRGVDLDDEEPPAHLPAPALLAMGALLLAPLGSRMAAEWQGAVAFDMNRMAFATMAGIVPYHVVGAAILLTMDTNPGSAESLDRAAKLVEETRRAPSPSPLFGAAKGCNLVLVLAESLQGFTVDLEVGGRAVTPNLSALSAESLRFAPFYEQTHLGTTADAGFLVHQSLYPVASGVVAERFFDNDFRGLAAVLAEHGYATFSTSASHREFWHRARMHASYGFRTSAFEDDLALNEMVGPWLSDRSLMRQTRNRIAKLKEPFFAYVLTASNHSPNLLPATLARQHSFGGDAVGHYLSTVNYFDAALGDLVRLLKQRGLLDRTVVAVFGDHQGFLFDAPALAGLLGYPAWGDGEKAMVRMQVPFVVRLPHGASAGVVPGPGGQLDVAPTLLSLLGIPAESEVMLGKDLTAGPRHHVYFRNGSIVTDDVLFLNKIGERGACYQVPSGRRCPCPPLGDARREAAAQFEASDAIIAVDAVEAIHRRLSRRR